MTSRLLVLPVVVVALLAASGCFSPDANPKPDDPPQAPEPRAKKTTAELLVGKWKLVKRIPANPGGPDMIFEYSQDGKVTMWINEQVRESRVESGTYRVEGKNLFRTFIGSSHTLERNTTIDSITEDKLVTSGSRTGELQIHEYERVGEKKE